AEDGIRDRTVTGVQTCALPILQSGVGWGARRDVQPSPESSQCQVARAERERLGGDPGRLDRAEPELVEHVEEPWEVWGGQALLRSEERRVGKEGRAGGEAGDET